MMAEGWARWKVYWSMRHKSAPWDSCTHSHRLCSHGSGWQGLVSSQQSQRQCTINEVAEDAEKIQDSVEYKRCRKESSKL